MALRYNPLSKPNPKKWLAIDEDIRMRMVVAYHRKKQFDLPNEQVHAIIHVIVENQVALGDETPVAETLNRLADEGLNRHDALHAIGSVLAGQIWEASRGENGSSSDPNDEYYEGLKNLNAQEWIMENSEPDE